METNPQIFVTIKKDGAYQQVSINPFLIDFIIPELFACALHFIDGTSLPILEDVKGLTKKIRQLNC